jgi:hypothetical protein
MSVNQTINPTQTLANDSRAQLEPSLEEFETHARNLCAQHDATGALTLIASDQVWNSIPANQTAAVRIAVGDPPHRARPTWDQPQPHANIVAVAVVFLFADYSMASSTLNTALLAIGQCWGEKPEPPQDDLPCPEAVHALSARNSRHHACQARCRY